LDAWPVRSVCSAAGLWDHDARNEPTHAFPPLQHPLRGWCRTDLQSAGSGRWLFAEQQEEPPENVEFIRTDPDVVGLIEVDTGSIRSGKVNQARHRPTLGHYSLYECNTARARSEPTPHCAQAGCTFLARGAASAKFMTGSTPHHRARARGRRQ
jgi:hypothetical protein